MDLLRTGKLIANLRKENQLTQKNLAEKLGICAKTISKWETGHGFPDMSLIVELSEIFKVDIQNLIEGELPQIKPESGNMKRAKFYVCEKCKNLIHSGGTPEIMCCGRKVLPLIPKEPDEAHRLKIEEVDNEYYISFSHPMDKTHYFTFFSYVRMERVLTVKLYPEQGGEIRIPKMYGGKIYYCCNNHGLFEIKG